MKSWLSWGKRVEEGCRRRNRDWTDDVRSIGDNVLCSIIRPSEWWIEKMRVLGRNSRLPPMNVSGIRKFKATRLTLAESSQTSPKVPWLFTICSNTSCGNLPFPSPSLIVLSSQRDARNPLPFACPLVIGWVLSQDVDRERICGGSDGDVGRSDDAWWARARERKFDSNNAPFVEAIDYDP